MSSQGDLATRGSSQDGSSTANQLHMEIRVGGFQFVGVGPRDAVFEAYERFKKDLDLFLDRGNHERPVSDVTLDTTGTAPTDEAVPLPVFLKERNLDTNALKAAAILVWADRYQGRTKLSPSEVEDYWKRTPFRLPGNMARDLATAATQGWVRQEGHGEYSPTGYGAREIDAREEQS